MKIVIQRLGEIKNKYKKANDLYNVIVYNQITDNNIIDEILKNDINKQNNYFGIRGSIFEDKK